MAISWRDTGLMKPTRLMSMGPFLLIAILLWTRPAGSTVQQESPPDSPLGTIVGHVAIGTELEVSALARVILMSSNWAELWNGAVQRSLDDYFNRYRADIARNRAAYNEIAGWAYRDAAGSVISEMQRSLGEKFSNWVSEVSADGGFEFSGVPLGDYRVVVVADVEGRTLIWAEAVRVSGPIPQLIEVQNIIQ